MSTMIKDKVTGKWKYVNRDLAFAPFEHTSVLRGLQFDPEVRNGIIAKKGWIFTVKDSAGIYRQYEFTKDTAFTFDSLAAGKHYMIHASIDTDTNELSLTAEEGEVWEDDVIGCFSTLCASVASTDTCRHYGTPTVGTTLLVHPSGDIWGKAFKDLYTKKVLSQTSDYYITTKVLAGFNAGDILPESVQCTTFRSGSMFSDCQTYEPSFDLFCDVYLGSGIQRNQRSKFGAVHTVSRLYGAMDYDLRTVGKMTPNDQEFDMLAMGSNCNTAIQGAKDWSTVGGHVDTAGARMISDIGCEETNGYLWQILRNMGGLQNTSGWSSAQNGHTNFGYQFCQPYQGDAGSAWDSGSHCGPSCRAWDNYRSVSFPNHGCRGVSRRV